jgi:hypothetical protein
VTKRPPAFGRIADDAISEPEEHDPDADLLADDGLDAVNEPYGGRPQR